MKKLNLDFEAFYGGSSKKRIVLILGWGNGLDDDCVKKLIQAFEKLGFDMLVVQIPTSINFEKTLKKIKERLGNLEDSIIVSFSMGSLFARHLESVLPKIFIAPYWYIRHENWIVSKRFSMTLLKFLKFVGLGNLHILPKDYGKINGDKESSFLNSKTVLEIENAQSNLPKIGVSDVVLYSKADTVIDVESLENFLTNNHVRNQTMPGKHQFFNSDEFEATMKIIQDNIKSP